MQKYLAVFKIAWQQGFVYRLNFTLWRVRTVLQLLLVYFIWWTIFSSTDQAFGYTQSTILTYILVVSLIRAIVLSSRAMEVANQINDGSIVNFLVRPLGFIKYYLTSDIADKLLNICFVIVEISIIIILLKPEIILQTDLSILIPFLIASILAVILYFSLSLMISMSAFWVENAWGAQFFLFIFLEGFAGGLFPIDILPQSISQILLLTPFPYLLYFPAKLYLGDLNFTQITQGFMILSFWVVTLWFLMMKVLKLGLKQYTAVGH